MVEDLGKSVRIMPIFALEPEMLGKPSWGWPLSGGHFETQDEFCVAPVVKSICTQKPLRQIWCFHTNLHDSANFVAQCVFDYMYVMMGFGLFQPLNLKNNNSKQTLSVFSLWWYL
jgi:hypothetical protein